MSEYKNIIGYISVAVALASYLPYFWGIYKGYIKPHAFTWFIWGTLTAIGFTASIVSDGGAGSWVMLVNAIACTAVAIIAFRQGHVKYVLFDWLALSGALIGILLWWYTNNPLTAVILITISDAIGILPSMRKAYYFPNEESITPWAMGIVYYILALFALESFTLTTWLYPVGIIVTDTVFILEIYIRRNQQKQN